MTLIQRNAQQLREIALKNQKNKDTPKMINTTNLSDTMKI